jgi:hypothetical protein
VGGGTDATRVASYNPWVSLNWLTTGRTLGGESMYGDDNILDREQALRRWTERSAWFSSEDGDKGRIAAGQLADLAVLSADYFSVPDEEIKNLASVLTVVDGKIVYADEEFSGHGGGSLPVSPDWSPVGSYGGHQGFVYYGSARSQERSKGHGAGCSHGRTHTHEANVFHEPVPMHQPWLETPFGAGYGCDCFAF